MPDVDRRGIRLILKAGKEGAVPAAEAVRALGKHGGARGKKQVDNINLKGGTQAAYLLARLQRDRPDIAARVAAGEFRSIRAASIEAGIVKVKRAEFFV